MELLKPELRGLPALPLHIGQLGEPLPVSSHFQPERLIVCSQSIRRHFAGLFGVPAIFVRRGHD